ncbi:MAG: amidohydrolase family protein [Chloroflexi bacterium]|nr:amidohydrolase family protein [Chloroflexota bacterium]
MPCHLWGAGPCGQAPDPERGRSSMDLGHPIVSGDSHLEVDSKNWIGRVPEKHRDRAPRVIRTEDGVDAWLVEGSPLRRNSSDLYGGKGRDVWTPNGQRYDETPGTGPGSQRVREQDSDGVSAEVLFPAQVAGPALWRSIEDDSAYRSVVQAYNGWLAEDYCSDAPERLIGVGVLPWTTVDHCVSEMERCRKLGLRTVVLGTFPSGKGYPTPEDDRFWAAAVDMDVPVTVHVQLNRSGSRAGPLFRYPKDLTADGSSRGGIVTQVANDKFCRLGGINAVQLLFAGVFNRFPNLRIDFAENQIGWIPHFYEQADERYERHWPWAEKLLGMPRLDREPSAYLRAHCLWGFQTDRAGVELRHHIGVDRLIWASDFPHQESSWPESRESIDRVFAGVPGTEIFKMVCGNVVDFFHLQDCYPTWEAAREAARD